MFFFAEGNVPLFDPSNRFLSYSIVCDLNLFSHFLRMCAIVMGAVYYDSSKGCAVSKKRCGKYFPFKCYILKEDCWQINSISEIVK